MIELPHVFIVVAAKAALLVWVGIEVRTFWMFIRGWRDQENVVHISVYSRLQVLRLLVVFTKYDRCSGVPASVKYTEVLNSVGEILYTPRLTQHQTKKALRVLQTTIREMADEYP